MIQDGTSWEELNEDLQKGSHAGAAALVVKGVAAAEIMQHFLPQQDKNVTFVSRITQRL